MNNKEQELIDLIRCHNSPGLALETAIGIVIDFLMQHESSQAQDPAYLREPA